MMRFDGFFFVFSLMFIAVFLLFLITVIKGIREWNRNNHAPRLTVDAVVTAKRADVTHHRTANAGDITGAHGYMHHTSTAYYTTFQVESGDRMELAVSGSEYGMLAEGDTGKLTFQGTRFLGFERIIPEQES